MDDKVEESELGELRYQPSQTGSPWEQELERHQCQVEILQEKLKEVKTSIRCSEDDEKELELLWSRIKATAKLLSYLKTKAQFVLAPDLANSSCGIKHQEGIGLIDKHGIPLSEWSKDFDISSFGSSDEEEAVDLGAVFESDGVYMGGMLNSVCLVADVMEVLVKRALLAENEVATEKEKVTSGVEEIRKKTLQIENMSTKVEEMEKLAHGANGILNEMRQKVEDMVQETSRQRQRATENEQELCRVKQDFESLRSYVSSLISVRETLLSSEQQFQTMEKLFDRLIAKTSHLETEKAQKEAEVQKLMVDNVGLRALLDKKEAQLLAMNEQCKFMALNKTGL